MLLFVELGDSANPVFIMVSAWLSPMSVGGWCFYLALSAACSLLIYRMLRSRLGSGPEQGSNNLQ